MSSSTDGGDKGGNQRPHGPDLSNVPIAVPTIPGIKPRSSAITAGGPAPQHPTTSVASLVPSTSSVQRASSSLDNEESYEDAWARVERELPVRVGDNTTIGTEGEQVLGNFFRFNIREDPKKPLCRYSIDLGPDVTRSSDPKSTKPRKLSRETKRFLVNSLLEANKHKFRTSFWICDYDSIIISAGRLFSVGSAPQPAPYQRKSGKDTSRTENGSIKFDGVVEIGELNRHISKKDGGVPSSATVIALNTLNVIFGNCVNKPDFDGARAGKRFYPPIPGNPIQTKSGCYLIHRGFFSSVRPGTGSLYLNVSTTTSAFFREMNLLAWMTMKWGNRYNEAKFRRELNNVRVKCDFTEEKRWTIHGELNTKRMSAITFGQTNVSDHMKSEHKKTYKDCEFGDEDFVPCVNVGGDLKKNQETWYPADVLTILPSQVVSHTLEGDDTQDMVNNAQIVPPENKKMILGQGLELLGFKNPSVLNSFSNFGIELTAKLDQITPIELQPPLMIAKENDLAVVKGGWRFNQSGSKGFHSSTRNFNELPIIWFDRSNGDKLPGHVTRRLRQVLNDYNVSHPESSVIKSIHEIKSTPKRGDDPIKYRKDCQDILDECLDTLEKQSEQGVNFLYIILKDKDANFYAEIKRWGDCVKGIPTICTRYSTLFPPEEKGKKRADFNDTALCANISQLSMTGTPKDTMIVGADCTHPGAGVEHCPSIAAIVATNDDESSQYLGSARLQKRRQEEIADLHGMMVERIKAWSHKASKAGKSGGNALPKHIFFYRDGVSESQLAMVLDKELPQIRSACNYFSSNSTSPKWSPTITLFVATKRHHARFFPKTDPKKPLPGPGKREEWDAWKENLKSGTLIDTSVVAPSRSEFYLQSHHNLLGTARSSYYILLKNESGLSFKQLEEATNRLCYTGARASKCPSICIPARYADLLCDRMRTYMRPSLNYGYVPNSGTGVSDFVADRDIWDVGTNEQNPWHKNMNNIMFYI
ncbi:hypothetical protein HYFRA_00002425 [Hymenoscyphus fraxineus]|uniref:Piwi domain-containing protein n=1 Tax=Hymenoscyphus fraxineus TaxID=746836 RepID=A0A9N9LA97_9HELO|nr:hypothetical protein HYFRA_00002425 [Hymenoscyphus fraxineus]